MLTKKTFTDSVRQKAIELGFSAIGFGKVNILGNEARRFQEWLSSGYHGTMKWMENDTDRRTNPGRMLPGATSLISVALNYYANGEHSLANDTCKISRYAWGGDYHDIIKEKLESLLCYIKERKPDAEGKIFVDAGPVMEKAWAEQTGIGWRGKHTIVITREFGSWVFLGEIICNVEFEYDPPATDVCGECRLCIDACPTRAIVDPYVLDAGRCISYLTVEHNGEIDPELGKSYHGWIFGCDICQDVCPWNRKSAQPTNEKRFHPRENNVSPTLASLIEMNNEAFSERFTGSPIRRRKLDRLMKNVQIVSQNISRS